MEEFQSIDAVAEREVAHQIPKLIHRRVAIGDDSEQSTLVNCVEELQWEEVDVAVRVTLHNRALDEDTICLQVNPLDVGI